MDDKKLEGLIGVMMNGTDENIKTELQKMIATDPVFTVSAESVQDPVRDPLAEEQSLSEMSALQDLSYKVELCLKKQKKLRFITKEISEIVKKSS